MVTLRLQELLIFLRLVFSFSFWDCKMSVTCFIRMLCFMSIILAFLRSLPGKYTQWGQLNQWTYSFKVDLVRFLHFLRCFEDIYDIWSTLVTDSSKDRHSWNSVSTPYLHLTTTWMFLPFSSRFPPLWTFEDMAPSCSRTPLYHALQIKRHINEAAQSSIQK